MRTVRKKARTGVQIEESTTPQFYKVYIAQYEDYIRTMKGQSKGPTPVMFEIDQVIFRKVRVVQKYKNSRFLQVRESPNSSCMTKEEQFSLDNLELMLLNENKGIRAIAEYLLGSRSLEE